MRILYFFVKSLTYWVIYLSLIYTCYRVYNHLIQVDAPQWLTTLDSVTPTLMLKSYMLDGAHVLTKKYFTKGIESKYTRLVKYKIKTISI